MTTVYTIGYGGREFADFVTVLKQHDIDILVDLRRFPRSKNPDFGRENLEVSLRKNGIEYVSLGKKLGGFRKGGFGKHMDTNQFMDGFSNLLDLIQKGTVVLMCMERKTEYCHRSFISQFLEDINIEVIHI